MGDQERMLPRVVKLADRLAGEIGARGLEPGDRFLTAAEAAKTLRVSMTLANRALQLLAQRGVIERRQRTGAVVAAPRSEFAAAGLARVAVFVPEADVVSEGLLEDGVIVGLQRALPGCSIGFHATGRNRDGDALEEMLRELGQQREPVGVVLVRSSLAAQRLAVQSGLPTVVFGTRRPSVRELDAIDRDHREAGRLLALRCLEGGRELLVLLNERTLPGDQLFLDGVEEAVLDRSPRPRVAIRFTPPDAAAVAAIVEAHLARLGDRRAIARVVCRSLPVALLAKRALGALRRRGRIGVADVYGSAVDQDLLVVVPAIGPERQGELIGEGLLQRLAEPTARAVETIIPVQVRG